MRIDPAPEFLVAVLRAEAECRGESDRLRRLTELREGRGLDALDAELDAAETMGLFGRWQEAIGEAAVSLEPLEVSQLVVDSAHGGMPTLRRDGAVARLAVDAAPVEEVAGLLSRLLERFVFDPETQVAQLDVGLGGTGGCATGECLPEDAPPGPLFEPRLRPRAVDGSRER
jgi:hypothetical protein